MSTIRKISASLLVAGVTIAGAITAAPAFAAPSTNAFPAFPSTDTLFGVDCETTNASYTIAVTATTALATPIGSVIGNGNGIPAGDDSTECTGGIAFNPVDGFVYGVLWNYPPNQMFPTSADGDWLVKIDPVSGTQTLVAEFQGACDGPWTFAVDNNGLGYATDGDKLCSVNLATGVTTEIGTDVLVGPVRDYAMGYDWKNNVLYMFSDGYEIYSVNTATGAFTLAATLPVVNDEVSCPSGGPDEVGFDASAGFDSNGVAWIQSDTCSSMPVAWKPGTNEYWYTGVVAAAGAIVNTDSEPIYAAGDTFYIEGFAIVRSALAETGPSSSSVESGALLAGGLLLVGAVAWIARRRIRA
jgi:hypothetical protein